MAKNLRTKMPEMDTIVIQDVNKAATKQFVDELSKYHVVIADSAREVAEKSVSYISSSVLLRHPFQ
jgi:hypothetical protein